MQQDLQDWCEYASVPLRWPDAFPLRTVLPLRVTLAAGCDPKLIRALCKLVLAPLLCCCKWPSLTFVLQTWLHGNTTKTLEMRRYVVIGARVPENISCADMWWQVVGDILTEGGWDARRLLHEAQSAEVKAKLHLTTNQ